MLALKKKRESEAKARAAAEAEATPSAMDLDKQEAGDDAGQDSSAPKKLSLLGVAGKKKSKSENGGSAGKKRTPGEIRIQKGESYVANRAPNNAVFFPEQHIY
jgi:hypothetical protein